MNAGRLLAVAFVVLTTSLALAADPPAFDGAAALRHVERLVGIGPRVAGTSGGARAREYIVAELKKIAGAQVQVKPFDADTPHGRQSMANVLAVLPGKRVDVVLLAGHYDT
jgi:acetylornithine deacetylase/succinyl-diaminopimelate desuccinylase-like protein